MLVFFSMPLFGRYVLVFFSMPLFGRYVLVLFIMDAATVDADRYAVLQANGLLAQVCWYGLL